MMKRAGPLFAALLVASCSRAEEPAPSPTTSSAESMSSPKSLNETRRPEYVHLSVNDRVQDILTHPAFAGHGRLVLPWDDRAPDEQMPLRRIGSLLPYHSHVEPRVVVESLNWMIDDAGRGQTIFYDFYTQAQKQADPTKENTGLFFFRGRPEAPFAVIAPGGGFAYVGSFHEGFPYAMEISKRGYNAFVVRYRAGLGERAATQDLAAAVSYLFRNATELGIDTAAYSVWGSSAGARMAANVGSHGLRPFGGDDRPKPAVVVMAYTGHSEYTAAEPSTFVVVGDQDGIALPAIMERRVAALRALGTTVEYHRYEGVGHGFGLGTGTNAEGWTGDAIRFWEAVIKRGR
jgi:acetyl esterase/lipase